MSGCFRNCRPDNPEYATTFQDLSNAYTSVKSNPSWSVVSDWTFTNFRTSTEIANEADVSVVARCLLGENSNVGSTAAERQKAIRCSAKVIMNRAANGGYGGSDYRSVVLASGQFDAMRGQNTGATNPVFYVGAINYWAYSMWVAHHMYSDMEPFNTDEIGSNYYFFYDTQAASGGSPGAFLKANGSPCTSVSDIISNGVYYQNTHQQLTVKSAVASVIFFSYKTV